MANVGEAKLVAKIALEVGEQIAPKATADSLNLLSVAGAKVEAAAKAVISPELKAAAHRSAADLRCKASLQRA